MTPKTARQTAGRAILDAFRAAGAVEVAPDILLPADILLDLYGEDIRARAYTTADPVRGEMMLRPDFTVPVVQMHMAGGAEPARYCYLGEVFRKQDHGDTRPQHPRDNEYLQAGFEMFSRDPDADAEVFALFHATLAPHGLTATMGDMDLLLDAVAGLPLSATRRAMLSHHLWRPRRFERLLDRFSVPVEPRSFAVNGAPWTGLRSPQAMQARIDRLETARAEPTLPRLVARPPAPPVRRSGRGTRRAVGTGHPGRTHARDLRRGDPARHATGRHRRARHRRRDDPVRRQPRPPHDGILRRDDLQLHRRPARLAAGRLGRAL